MSVLMSSSRNVFHSFAGMDEFDRIWSYIINQTAYTSLLSCDRVNLKRGVPRTWRVGEVQEWWQYLTDVRRKRSEGSRFLDRAFIFYRLLLGWEVFSCLYIQRKIKSCKKANKLMPLNSLRVFLPHWLGGGSLEERAERVSCSTEGFPSAASNPSHMFLIDLQKPQ